MKKVAGGRKLPAKAKKRKFREEVEDSERATASSGEMRQPTMVARLIGEATEAQLSGQYQQAANKYQQVLGLEHGAVHNAILCKFNMAICMTALKRTAAAKELYLQLAPKLEAAVHNLFGLLLHEGQLVEALELMRSNIGTLRRNALSVHNMAVLHIKTNNLKQAETELHRLTRSTNCQVAVRANLLLGSCYQKCGNPEKALECYNCAQQIKFDERLANYIRVFTATNLRATNIGENLVRQLKNNNFFLQDAKGQKVPARQASVSRAQTNLPDVVTPVSTQSATFDKLCVRLEDFKESVFRIRPSILSTRHNSNVSSTLQLPATTSKHEQASQVSQPSSTISCDEIEEDKHQPERRKLVPVPAIAMGLIDDYLDEAPVGLEWVPTISAPLQQDVIHLIKPQWEVVVCPPSTDEFPCEFVRSQLYSNWRIANESAQAEGCTSKDESLSNTITMVTSTNTMSAGCHFLADAGGNPLSKSTQSLYYQAVLLNNLGDSRSAIARLKKALRERVEDRSAVLTLLVGIYRKLELPYKQIVYLKKLAEQGSRQACFRLEEMFRGMNRTDKALQTLQKGLVRHLKDPDFFERIGSIHLQQNSLEKAIDYLEKAYSLEHGSSSIRNKLIHAYSLSKSTMEECKALLTEAMTEGDTNDYLQLLVGLFIQSQFQGGTRVQLLTKLPNKPASHSINLLLLGAAYKQLGHNQKAYQSFRESALGNSFNSLALLELVTFYIESGELGTASALLQAISTVRPGSDQTVLAYARLAQAEYRYAEARRLYKDILDRQPENYRLLTSIAQCYKQQAVYQKALQYFKKSLQLNSQQPQVLLQMAECCRQTYQLDRALKYYDRACSMQGQLSYTCALEQIVCLIQSANSAKALQLLQRISSNQPEVLLARATCEYLTGSYQKAIELYGQLQQSADLHVVMLSFNLGVCYHKLHDYENAQRCYLTVLKADGNHSRTLFNYGVLLKEIGNSQSLEYLERAIMIEYQYGWVVFYVEQLLSNQRYHEADEHIKKLTKASPPEIRQKGYFLQAKLSVMIRQDRSTIMVRAFGRMFPESELNGQLEHLLEESSEDLLSLRLDSQLGHSNVSLQCPQPTY